MDDSRVDPVRGPIDMLLWAHLPLLGFQPVGKSPLALFPKGPPSTHEGSSQEQDCILRPTEILIFAGPTFQACADQECGIPSQLAPGKPPLSFFLCPTCVPGRQRGFVVLGKSIALFSASTGDEFTSWVSHISTGVSNTYLPCTPRAPYQSNLAGTTHSVLNNRGRR